MKKVRFGEYELSHLMLGTVQFGLPYGIANKTGQPSYETVRQIIATAYQGGVNCFDTAPLYGTSEELLGQVLRELGIKQRVIVETKIEHMAEDYSSLRAVDETVERSVVRSLKRLGLEILPICLFHNEQNFKYIDSLLKLRDRGLVQNVGSSVTTPQGAAAILDSGLVQIIQLPTNLLDHQFTRGGIFGKANKQNVALVVRSIYLQGLFHLKDEEILPELSEAIPVLRKLNSLAADAAMSISELAVRYVLSLEGTTCGVIGVDSVKQMEENIELFSKSPLEPELIKAVVEIVPDLPGHILMPFKWSKRMADAKPERR